MVNLQVASFGAFLLEKEVLTMSVAPRDSYKAQVQFALERGLPAFVGMLGTQRLPFPSLAFDLVHCSRCLVPFAAFSMSLCLSFFAHVTLPLFMDSLLNINFCRA